MVSASNLQAESWVNNMSGSAMESTEVDDDGRPPRLGLGAKVMLKSNVGASTDPVERKLRAKLDAKKRAAAKNKEESNPSESHVGDSSDDDPVSRTNAFIKKRTLSSVVPSPRNKKHK